jgi:isochorismate synthase EntC
VEAIAGPPRFEARTTVRRFETTERGPAAIWRWFAESF